MTKLVVDSVMSSPVYSIDAETKGGDALRKMRETGTKMILVTKNGEPQGILEAWMVTSLDMDRPVKELELSRFGTIDRGEELTRLNPWPSGVRAAYVLDKDKKPIGVVTQYDLRKGAWSSLF